MNTTYTVTALVSVILVSLRAKGSEGLSELNSFIMYVISLYVLYNIVVIVSIDYNQLVRTDYVSK